MKKRNKLKEKIIKAIIEYLVGGIVLLIIFLLLMYGLSISPTIIK